MASPAVDFARNNQQRFLNELKNLLRIPSVSTLDEHKSDVRHAADFVANELRRIGMENVEIIPTKGHPLIYADWLHAPGTPTVRANGSSQWTRSGGSGTPNALGMPSAGWRSMRSNASPWART